MIGPFLITYLGASVKEVRTNTKPILILIPWF